MASRPVAALVVAAALAAGCAGELRRFPMRMPIQHDTDTRWVHVPCRPADKPGKPPKCMPEEYVSSLAWDAADNTVFRPLARLWIFSLGGEAPNANSFDEVADSSWFENRIGVRPPTVEELERGSCASKHVLVPDGPDGSWVIDQGKENGATPGFRVKAPDVGRFLFKVDEAEIAERSNAASVIGSRIYNALGFYTPCENIVDVPRSLLKLTPGLKSTSNAGVTTAFDEKALDRMWAKGIRVGDRLRVEASQFIPGVPIGPFKYEGTRDDDPNDVIPHEDRRELRGARLLAAWLNHFDAREQNTLNSWIAAPGVDPSGSPGYVRHYYLDFSDSFGSTWDWPGISIRLGFSYYLDFGHVLVDFLTLGIIERPWDRVKESPEAPIFHYFSARDFDPEGWHSGYPNPAFERMSERDGAWMARLISRLTPDDVHVLVGTGELLPKYARYLEDTLLARQQAILRRFLGRLSPLADVTADDTGVCAVDLARRAAVFADDRFVYRARVESRDLAVRVEPEGRLCVAVDHLGSLAGIPDNDARRYRVVSVYNGIARGRLEIHLYDLGAGRGYFIAGLARPND